MSDEPDAKLWRTLYMAEVVVLTVLMVLMYLLQEAYR